MIVPGQLAQRFRNAQPYVRHVGEVVRQTVAAYCDREGFAFQSRPKTMESVAEKVETGRFGCWSEIDDLYACAVILPSLLFEDAAVAFLREAFEQVRLTSRSSKQKDPAIFRFDCTRFIGRLRLPNEGRDSPDELRNMCFEVQVRTAFEHAWQVATHSFTYKAESIEWRRLRVAAQLKANVEQLDNLILSLEEAAEHIVENRWPDVEAWSRVLAFFRTQIERGQLPPEVAPKDWTRFCENVVTLLKTYGPARQALLATVDAALAILERDLASRDAAEHPRSVSLWQYVFGALSAAGLLTPVAGRYRPFITNELRALFPALAPFTQTFELAT